MAIDVVQPINAGHGDINTTALTAGIGFLLLLMLRLTLAPSILTSLAAVGLSVFTGPTRVLADWRDHFGNCLERPCSFPAVILETAGTYVLQATSANATSDAGTITVVAGVEAAFILRKTKNRQQTWSLEPTSASKSRRWTSWKPDRFDGNVSMTMLKQPGRHRPWAGQRA